MRILYFGIALALGISSCSTRGREVPTEGPLPPTIALPTLAIEASPAATALPSAAPSEQASVPPEGSMILYVESGACVAKAVGIEGGEPITITTDPPPYDCWRPKFSPDGKKLAFVPIDGNYDLYVMDLDGSGLTMVADAIAFAWSPDSTQLVYQSYDPEKELKGLAIVNADGSGAHTVGYTDTSVCTYCDGDIDLSWSPDGQWIYAPADLTFPEMGPVTANIFKVDGTEHRELGKVEISTLAAAAWSPDSQSVAVFSLPEEGCGVIDIFSLDGSHKRLSGENAYKMDEPGRAPSCYYDQLLWSPDGKSILAFGRPQGDFAPGEVTYDRVLVTSVDGETSSLLEYWPGHPGPSLWSPDGSQIVFISSPDMGESYIDGPLVIMRNDPSFPEFRILVDTAKNSWGGLYWLDR